MYTYLVFVGVILALGVITFVLLQRGKGAEAGAAFGGASQSVFGASGSGNFLTKTTSLLMAAFFIVNLLLVYLGVKQNEVNQLAVEPVVEAVEEVVVPQAGAEDLE